MDVRAHLASRTVVSADMQYVKTGQLVSPELVQYLEDLFPDKLSSFDAINCSKDEIAYFAGQVNVVQKLRDMMEAAQQHRSERATVIVQGANNV